MTRTNDTFSFEVLVELLAEHYGQSAEGTPVERVEQRLVRSIELAVEAGLVDLNLYLERHDFAWLCNARGVDRLSLSAARMRIGDVLVHRAKPGCESYISGMFDDEETEGLRIFPILADPSLTPGFVQHVPTEDEKRAMLEKLKVAGMTNMLKQAPAGSTLH